jgi:lysophospholipase L1-like esterase
MVSGIVYAENKGEYAAESSKAKNSPLRSKKILFLGSSVAYGVGFKGEFVECFEKIDGVEALKEAVSGTALVDSGKNSYVSRLKAVDKSLALDAFVCQLSTNDATKKLPLGTVSSNGSCDISTIAGAIVEIISYVNDIWGCPIIFFTGMRYDDAHYGEMVALLHEIKKKWNIGVIGMWSDEQLNSISDADY